MAVCASGRESTLSNKVEMDVESPQEPVSRCVELTARDEDQGPTWLCFGPDATG